MEEPARVLPSEPKMIFEEQDHQRDCVDNIVEVLRKSERLQNLSSLESSLKKLQHDKHMPMNLRETSRAKKLDVLMETGTGKTYTYLETMHRLHQEYRINKFLLFVPRIAIKEGVLQNIKLTANHFFTEKGYEKKIEVCTYDGKVAVEKILRFIREEKLSLLILTSASVASSTGGRRLLRTNGGRSATRWLLEQHEKGEREEIQLSLLARIAKQKPVIFIDEPHLLKGEIFSQVYRDHFSASLCIRFGATFPKVEEHKLSNVVYALDSLTAFRDHLVKEITVNTLSSQGASVRFLGRTKDKKGNKKIIITYRQNNAWHKKEVAYGETIGIEGYEEIHVVKVRGKKIYLSDNNTRELYSSDYTLSDITLEKMIGATIDLHFEKESRLFAKNIKTLSLFFIPNIADFKGERAKIRDIFDRVYKVKRKEILEEKTLTQDYRDYLEKDYDSDGALRVRGGYFSGDRGTKDEIERQAVHDILKDKASLLSLSNPLRFIFSVWALQEGWDNPNIFNLCKLAPTQQDISRRQQVGRGLRLAVDTKGKRHTFESCDENESDFYDINGLDVVVSDDEKDFIEQIQGEIVGGSYSLGGGEISHDLLTNIGLNSQGAHKLISWLEEEKVIAPSADGDSYIVKKPIANFLREHRDSSPDILAEKYEFLIKEFEKMGRSPIRKHKVEKKMIGVKSEKFQEFAELWKTITTQASIRYEAIDEDKLAAEVEKAFAQEQISPVQDTLTIKKYDHDKDKIVSIEEKKLDNVEFFKKNEYAEFVRRFAQKEKLPLHFVFKLFNKLGRKKIKNNPEKARQHLIRIVQNEIHKCVIQSVEYNFSEVSVSSRSDVFHDAEERVLKEIEAGKIGCSISEKLPTESFLYDTVVYDAKIEEQAAVEVPRTVGGHEVVVFAKLPRISIPTPYKEYNPDFAYFIKTNEGKKLFLIVETKGYDAHGDIPPAEQKKIDYGKKFFLQMSKHLANKGKDVRVEFKSSINKESLLDLLQEVLAETKTVEGGQGHGRRDAE